MSYDAIEVRKQASSGWSGGRATLDVTLPSGRTASVTAYGGDYSFGPITRTERKVNWSAIGSASLDDAEAYALAILEAVRIAREELQDATGPEVQS